ncbi:uncharacterized protein FTOL_13698 [Fusarium torulosum]|uniref:Uncharacterized protein n=1 Tax=Fusarium torulosum TaxID=33205 RepID=A0AAE8SQG8_9HYPO|nr:uncharacterized protein FTOL_13698 [Fusarium torulosum]
MAGSPCLNDTNLQIWLQSVAGNRTMPDRFSWHQIVTWYRGALICPGGLVYPNAKASVIFAPEIYWQEQFPVAAADVDLDIRGTPFVLSGIGGRDKNWNPRPWAVISGNWDMGRIITGPYGLMFWN